MLAGVRVAVVPFCKQMLVFLNVEAMVMYNIRSVASLFPSNALHAYLVEVNVTLIDWERLEWSIIGRRHPIVLHSVSGEVWYD